MTVARLTKRQVLTASGFTLPTPRLFAGRFVFSEILPVYFQHLHPTRVGTWKYTYSLRH